MLSASYLTRKVSRCIISHRSKRLSLFLREENVQKPEVLSGSRKTFGASSRQGMNLSSSWTRFAMESGEPGLLRQQQPTTFPRGARFYGRFSKRVRLQTWKQIK